MTGLTPNGNGIYRQQIRNVSLVYNAYRIVLPLVLLLTYLSNSSSPGLGILNPRLFVIVACAYAFIGVAALIFSTLRADAFEDQRLQIAVLLLDVLILTFLAYLSHGVVSGLSLLLIVNVAFASMLTRGRVGTFVAAVATLAVIFCEVYLTLSLNDFEGQFLQAGILGIILFATSLYIQTASSRALDAARLAEEQATSIVDLEKLNNEIIQRMRTGIVVVNAENAIITLNNAAKSLLGPVLETEQTTTGSRPALPSQLVEQLVKWRRNPLMQGDLLKIPGPNISLQTNFAYLNQETDSDILIFIENQSRIMQRIRQTKLASLGRLTANIAHEIRNPLGAISHATQILEESEQISDEQKRMLEIIMNQSRRMNRIIEEVLDVSRHKDVAPSLINLREWVSEFVSQYRLSNRECDEVTFEYQGEDLEMRLITSQMERVFTNLFDNGLRYSRKATGKASLRILAGLKQGAGDRKQPFVSVIDEGPGLDEEAESRLFEPFHTTESSGTGLGLYISKELCEANQATLDYSVTDSGTSCFTVNFSTNNPRSRKAE
ncbi:MAG: histidine kinase dimerization/phospho-acceptor domain-containing protein [Gammaproteobacteria bacterium]